MLYGISSLDETDVACFITIDLQMFFMNFLDGKIAVDLNQRNNSVIRDGIIYGATFQNQDNSSIMTYFDCSQIYELFPEMILYNKGFLLTENDKKNQPTTGQRLLIQQLIKKHTASLDLLTEEEAWVLIDCLKKNNEDLITLLKSNNFRLNPVVPYEVNPDKVIGSKPRTTFHRIGCTYEPKTKEKRIVFENIQSAIDAGFKPCNHCKPLVKAVDIE